MHLSARTIVFRSRVLKTKLYQSRWRDVSIVQDERGQKPDKRRAFGTYRPTRYESSTADLHQDYHDTLLQETQDSSLETSSNPEPEPDIVPQSKLTHFSPEDEANALLRGPPSKSEKPKYYAIIAGHEPGIYTDWHTAKKQVTGYPDSKYKKFTSMLEALDNFKEHHRSRLAETYETTQPAQYNPRSSQFNGHTKVSSTVSLQSSHIAQPSAQAPGPAKHNASISISSTPVRHVKLSPAAREEYGIRGGSQLTLVPEQQRVVDLILEGHNVFYTGSAGSGKSAILKTFVEKLKERGKSVQIVAPTNLAALQVNGQTTWAFAGWTPSSLKQPLKKLARNARKEEFRTKFNDTDVLVIDEISMIENHFFERLSEIMKSSRGYKRGGPPFGDVQVVVTGDFAQLSPVKPFQNCLCGGSLVPDTHWKPTEYKCEDYYCGQVFYDIDKWAFRSRAWKECNFKHVKLTQIHRQNDEEFIGILQRIRLNGSITDADAAILLNHPSETEKAIEIFPRREDVDRINNKNIAQLPSEPYFFTSGDNYDLKIHHRDQQSLEKYTKRADDGTLHFLKEYRYEAKLQLKKGQRVVLQQNLAPRSGLVNGAQGTIVGFGPYLPLQDPKSEGKSLTLHDPNDEEITDSFESQLSLSGSHAQYREDQIKIFAAENGYPLWPRVKFDNGLESLIIPDCMVTEFGTKKPYSVISRTQIPLMAGYAITVHKAQGMTLDRVVVDLSRSFESSQIYVALSRARSLQGLKVLGLPRHHLGGANAQVKEFFQEHLKDA